jgi:hypothetical protein
MLDLAVEGEHLVVTSLTSHFYRAQWAMAVLAVEGEPLTQETTFHLAQMVVAEVMEPAQQ